MQALEAGAHARGRQLGTELLRIDPTLARVHWLLASIGLEVGDIGSALDHVRAADRLAAKTPPHQLVAITRLMIAVGEFESAGRLLDQMRSGGFMGTSMIAIGEQLLMLERHQDALTCLGEAEAGGIRHPMLSFLISSACRCIGDFDRAIEAAEATLRQQPDFVHAHWSLSHLGAKSGAGGRIDRVRRSIASLSQRRNAGSAQMQSGIALLWHCLFRELDAVDDRSGAWSALANGLAIKRRLQAHDPAAEDRLFDRLILTYSDRFVAAADAPVASVVRPIFVVGMPRTGTTLVERIITNHTQVAGCGELDELQLLVKRTTGRWSNEFLGANVAQALGATDFKNLGCAYLDATAWRVGGHRFMVDKHQSNFLLSGIIARCLPQARIVCVRRDPIDACFSNLKEPFAPHAYSYSNDQTDVANHYRNFNRLMRHMQEVAGDRILEVSYEDVVHGRERQSARILEFVGLNAEPGVSDISRNRKPIASASSVQVREPIHDRNIGGWRRYADQLVPLQQAFPG